MEVQVSVTYLAGRVDDVEELASATAAELNESMAVVNGKELQWLSVYDAKKLYFHSLTEKLYSIGPEIEME